jgi:hypothetical protein
MINGRIRLSITRSNMKNGSGWRRRVHRKSRQGYKLGTLIDINLIGIRITRQHGRNAHEFLPGHDINRKDR